MKYFTFTYDAQQMIVQTIDDEVRFIPLDEANTDYIAYLAWVAKGNTAAEWLPKA